MREVVICYKMFSYASCGVGFISTLLPFILSLFPQRKHADCLYKPTRSYVLTGANGSPTRQVKGPLQWQGWWVLGQILGWLRGPGGSQLWFWEWCPGKLSWKSWKCPADTGACAVIEGPDPKLQGHEDERTMPQISKVTTHSSHSLGSAVVPSWRPAQPGHKPESLAMPVSQGQKTRCQHGHGGVKCFFFFSWLSLYFFLSSVWILVYFTSLFSSLSFFFLFLCEAELSLATRVTQNHPLKE